MGAVYQVFCRPKRGHRDDEYEDACAADAVAGRFAVADGASESSFAASWAKLLVEDFVRAPEVRPVAWADRLPPLQEQWAATLGGQALPWYAEAKLQQGAFATFLGVVLEPAEGWRRSRWVALAVGDSCLFHVRDDALVRAFPLKRAADFGNQPWLVGSRTTPAELLARKPFHVRKGRWQEGDRLWLMTDALAQWFLTETEVGRRPWQDLDAHTTDEIAFAAWIEELREAKALRNDDVTVIRVEGGG